MTPLLPGIALIYPTTALLQPEKRHNFVSMHYLLKTVRRAKVIFVISESEITNLLRNFKGEITNLFSLFKND
jgi:hypothetical protein